MKQKSKRGRGRPAIITLSVVKAIGQKIAQGLTEEQACVLVGVNHESFRTARHRKPEFETAIKKAQAVFLGEALRKIAAGEPGWQGCAWILERRHKPQFNRTDTHALTDNNGEGLLTAEDQAELQRLARRLFVDEITALRTSE